MEKDEKINKREEAFKKWFSDWDNLAAFGILIFAIGLRLHYFFITKTQPLWWDDNLSKGYKIIELNKLVEEE